MSEDDGAIPTLGSRIEVCRDGGKWAAATVVQVDGPPPLPVRLQYPDGSMEWARFACSSVMLAWRCPQVGKRSAAAAAAPAHAATKVQAFVALADDAPLRGRLSKARKQARSTALAAAEAYAEQQQTPPPQQQEQQQGASARGSPTKRRRLGKSPNLPPAEAGSGSFQGRSVEDEAQQEQHAEHEQASADGLLPPSALGDRGDAASGEQDVAGSDHEQHLPQLPPAATAAATTAAAEAGPGSPPQQQPMQQQAPPSDLVSRPAEDQVPADSQPTAPAADTPPQPAVPTPAMPAHEAAGAASASVQRPAVTSLGDDSISALAPLSVSQPGNGQVGKSPQPTPKRQLTSAARKRQQQQQQRKQQRERPQQGHQPRQAGQDLSRAPSAGHGVGSPQAPALAEQQDPEDAEPEAAAPPPERPGEAACRRFAALLPNLSFLKESITAAAAAAIAAGREGACKEVVRSVVDRMERNAGPGQRVPLFYLLDAVLAHSRKRDGEGCGPDSTVGTLFPRAVGAALGRLVDLLGAHLSDAQKMERTLVNTWSVESKRGVQPSLVQHALQKLRERIAQHQSAWADGGGSGGGSATKQRASSGGRPGVLTERGLQQLYQRTSLQAVPVLTYVNIKDGSKVTLTCKRLASDAWPDYSQLPLPPGAEIEQHGAIAAAGRAAATQEPPVAELSSPWHSTLNLGDWADNPWAVEQARAAAASVERQRYEAAVAAQRAAALAHADRLQQQAAQQQRGQSTAAAAEADEFDMSLFKEATGGVRAAPLEQAALLPDLLLPMGRPAWAHPPLPDQSPPPLPDGSAALPPLPGGWPEEEEEEELGPPPLPPHSPPRDEYEMDMEEDEGTPPLPPGDNSDAPPLPQTAAAPPPPAAAPAAPQQRQQQQQQAGQALSYSPIWAPSAAPVGPPGFLPAAAGQRQQPAVAAAYGASPAAPWATPASTQQQAPVAALPPGLGVGPSAGAAPPRLPVSTVALQASQMQQPAFPLDPLQAASIQQQRQQQQQFLAAQQKTMLSMQAVAAQQAAPMRGMAGPPGFMLPELQAQQAALVFSTGMPHLARAPSTGSTHPVMPMHQQLPANQPTPQQLAFTPGQQPPSG
ncbi:hypothetical protein ABPG77_008298 [Micractinium sp. CCAP 211/92]